VRISSNCLFRKAMLRNRSICESHAARASKPSAQAGSVIRSRGLPSGNRLGKGISRHGRPYQFHFPLRTHPKVRHASRHDDRITLAKVTGSAPGASQIPQPSTATIICTSFCRGDQHRTRGATSIRTCLRQNMVQRPVAHAGSYCRSILRRGLITFPDATFSFTAAKPRSRCNSRGGRNHISGRLCPIAAEFPARLNRGLIVYRPGGNVNHSPA